MADIGAWYLLQFVPIVLGIIFFVSISNINIGNENIVIDLPNATTDPRKESAVQTERIFDNRFPVLVTRSTGNSYVQVWRGYAGSFEDMQSRVFLRKAYDCLLQKGVQASHMSLREIENSAYDKAGMTSIARIQRIERSKRTVANKLTVFAPDIHRLMASILSFNHVSGILVSYLANYKLEVIGA